MDQRAVDKKVQGRGQRRAASVAMSRSEARAWKARWALVNQAELDELRLTPISTKFRQALAMMGTALHFGWRTSSAREVAEVRRRWNQLRSLYRE